MPVSAARLLILLLAAGMSAACAPPPAPTRQAPTTDSTKQPTLVPTPTLAADFTGPKLLPAGDGSWQASGLFTNQSQTTVHAPQLAVQLLDAQGNPLAEELAVVGLPLLPPGATSPYQATFPPELSPEAARLVIRSYTPSSGSHVPLAVELVASYALPAGGSRVLGLIGVEGSRGAELAGLSLGLFEFGELVAVSQSITGPLWLRPGEQATFEAILPQAAALDQLTAFAVASAGRLPPPALVEADLEPGVAFDEQGHPLLAGTLRNPAAMPAYVRLLVTVVVAGQPARVVELASPIPLRPGESRAFGLRLEDLPDSDDPDGFGVEITVEPLPGAGAAALATLEPVIQSVEQLAGSVFLRGSLANPTAFDVFDPTLFAALRTTDGELISAGWLPAAAELPAGGAIGFVLALPLPAGVDLALAEYDLQALAWRPAGG